ncbi:MAG: hypothetical protein JNM99_20965 [Verrucomicrobiaceae bacterium]|nr:hypothetical protein [Verrucomicrobiaceae bacterium]
MPNETSDTRKRLRPYMEKERLRTPTGIQQMTEAAFVRGVEIARMAIEIARLNRSAEPEAFLNRAVTLINRGAECSYFDPDKALHESIECAEYESRIPYAQVVGYHAEDRFELHYIDDDDKEKTAWIKRYSASENAKGFRGFLMTYFRTQWVRRDQRAFIQLLAGNRKNKIRGVRTLLNKGYYRNRAHLVDQAFQLVGDGKGKRWAKRVYDQWLELGAAEASSELIQDAKENGFSLVDLLAFSRVKQTTNKLKGRRKKEQVEKTALPELKDRKNSEKSRKNSRNQ